MKKNKQYQIKDFYIGEIYFYTQFAGIKEDTYIKNRLEKIESFSQTGAINFQPDMISRYIDWENKREYTGFLTIFYKQGSKYVCLHDGIAYELNSPVIIDNLIPLTELLPKINTTLLSKISINEALQLFDTLFKKDNSILYNNQEQQISDFYVGDLSLKQIYSQENNPDSRNTYVDLPHHIMLHNPDLSIYSYKDSDYTNTVYRCLFLKDIVDLYNTNNNQFYNPHEDRFENIISFQDYIQQFNIPITKETISIPKALKYFKRTI